MLLTTTPTVEGRPIREYHGIVTAEVILGVNVLKDIAASFRDFFGGRSKTYENSLKEGRDNALNELANKAVAMNANAVVGIKIDYETVGQGSMLMIVASGTAVTI